MLLSANPWIRTMGTLLPTTASNIEAGCGVRFRVERTSSDRQLHPPEVQRLHGALFANKRSGNLDSKSIQIV
jgi:hypothetical protein